MVALTNDIAALIGFGCEAVCWGMYHSNVNCECIDELTASAGQGSISFCSSSQSSSSSAASGRTTPM